MVRGALRSKVTSSLGAPFAGTGVPVGADAVDTPCCVVTVEGGFESDSCVAAGRGCPGSVSRSRRIGDVRAPLSAELGDVDSLVIVAGGTAWGSCVTVAGGGGLSGTSMGLQFSEAPRFSGVDCWLPGVDESPTSRTVSLWRATASPVWVWGSSRGGRRPVGVSVCGEVGVTDRLCGTVGGVGGVFWLSLVLPFKAWASLLRDLLVPNAGSVWTRARFRSMTEYRLLCPLAAPELSTSFGGRSRVCLGASGERRKAARREYVLNLTYSSSARLGSEVMGAALGGLQAGLSGVRPGLVAGTVEFAAPRPLRRRVSQRGGAARASRRGKGLWAVRVVESRSLRRVARVSRRRHCRSWDLAKRNG